jgi:uncharacterized protein (TIGR03437 family)
MTAARLLLFTVTLSAQPRPGYPYYTPESIANAAANVANSAAPNTFLSIYGTDLAYVTKAMAPDDIRSGMLPTVLSNTGVRVLLNLVPMIIYFVSPGQVNVLVPSTFAPGPATLQLVRDGVSGPQVRIALQNTAPAIFQLDNKIVIATHGNSPIITPESPAHRNEIIVVYATGLGPVSPPTPPGRIADAAARITTPDFRVVLNNTRIDAARIQYAGLTPGYAGLYQINIQLPADAPVNPEIRIGFGDQLSPEGRILPIAE